MCFRALHGQGGPAARPGPARSGRAGPGRAVRAGPGSIISKSHRAGPGREITGPGRAGLVSIQPVKSR